MEAGWLRLHQGDVRNRGNRMLGAREAMPTEPELSVGSGTLFGYLSHECFSKVDPDGKGQPARQRIFGGSMGSGR